MSNFDSKVHEAVLREMKRSSILSPASYDNSTYVLSGVGGVDITQSSSDSNYNRSILENFKSVLNDGDSFRSLDKFVYVYDIGPEYNEDLKASDIRWWSQQYEPEYVLHEMLAVQNISRTFNPEEASLFYVPFLSARFTLINFVDDDDGSGMKKAVMKTSEVWKKILNDIKQKHRYFNYSNGRDHFSVLTMDHGRCTALTFCDPSVYGEMFFFQLNADKMVRSIHISTSRGIQALTYNYGQKVSNELPDIPCYMADRDIVVPPLTTVKDVTKPSETERPITALFRFSAGQHHGIPIPHFNHLIRKELLDKYKGMYYENWSFDLKSEWATKSDWKASKFCVCPPGHSQWTSRPTKSILSGCIPVTFYRDHDYPWTGEVDHSLFSINIDPEYLGDLKLIIDTIVAKPDFLRAIQSKLEAAQSSYNWEAGVPGGAREYVMKFLKLRAIKLRNSF